VRVDESLHPADVIGAVALVVADATFGFAGHYVSGPATISFTATNDGSSVVYTSDAAGQTNPGPPGVGTEQNGVFFH
jgi:hypothetical protein